MSDRCSNSFLHPPPRHHRSFFYHLTIFLCALFSLHVVLEHSTIMSISRASFLARDIVLGLIDDVCVSAKFFEETFQGSQVALYLVTLCFSLCSSCYQILGSIPSVTPSVEFSGC